MRLFEGMTAPSENENTSANNKVNNGETTSSVEKLPKPVYYIESPSDNTVLVGINVTISKGKMGEKDIFDINWYDTFYQRGMMASVTEKKDDYFAFKRVEEEGGGYYYFSPMNLEIYNNKVKQHLISGDDFASEDDLIEAFLATTDNEFN